MTFRNFVLVIAGVLPIGCKGAGECPAAELSVLQTRPAYAVLTSDYQSSAVALLDDEGRCFTEAWVDSGTTRAGLTTTLSGDVVLASTQPKDALLIVDRFGSDVVTRISTQGAPSPEQFVTQVRQGDGQTGYRPNPRDAALVEGKLWVSRYEPNPRPNTSELNLGNDIVIIDPMSKTIERRIDLSPLNREENSTLYFARPDRLVVRHQEAWVGLGRLNAGFTKVGPGAIGKIDLQTLQATSIEFDAGGLRNCGEVVSGLDDNVWIVCTGATFSGNESRRGSAGILRLDVTSEVEPIWLAKEHQDRCVPGNGLVPLGAEDFVVPCWGDATRRGDGDSLVHVNTKTQTFDVIYTSSEAFSLGIGTFNPDHQMLFVPDGKAGVLRWTLTTNGSGEKQLIELGSIDSSPCRNLPAREVHRL